MITKQQISINYIEEISIKSDAKNVKYCQIVKKWLQAFGNSLAMITKEQIKINYIKEITIKCYPEKMKYYQILKKVL